MLLALAAAGVIGLYLTRTSPGARALNADEQPLDTAHELAPLAQGEEEQKLAADALRLADHQLDLAFTGALRTASDQAQKQTPEIRTVQERIDRGQSDIAAGNDRIAQLKAAAARATGDRQAALAQQVEILQAEVSLHQDELADAQQDLIRAGGDERSRIQELLDQHNAAEHSSQGGQTGTTAAGANPVATPKAANVIAQASAWSALRAKQQQIAVAQREALTMAAALSSDHIALDQQVDREKTARQANGSPSAAGAPAQAAPPAHSVASAAENAAQLAAQGAAAAQNLKSLHRLSDDEKSLAEFDRRIQDLQELAATYAQWNGLVEFKPARRCIG